MKIAISGKGGVGKTLIAGVLACYFAHKGFKTMAIDTDPSPNLALTLGLPPEETRKIVPISENEELIKSKTDTGFSGVYRLTFTVNDIVSKFSIQTPCEVSLIVMGTVKAMDSGCTCAANALIKTLLRHMVVERNEVVLVDMEAGVEHLGRGTAKNVDIMIIVTDSSIKSLETAKHIHELAKNAGIKNISLVGNKIANEPQKEAISHFAQKNDLKTFSFVPFDDNVVTAEMKGETPLRYKNSSSIKAIEEIGDKILQPTSS